MARLARGQTSVITLKFGACNMYKIVSESVQNVLACKYIAHTFKLHTCFKIRRLFCDLYRFFYYGWSLRKWVTLTKSIIDHDILRPSNGLVVIQITSVAYGLKKFLPTVNLVKLLCFQRWAKAAVQPATILAWHFSRRSGQLWWNVGWQTQKTTNGTSATGKYFLEPNYKNFSCSFLNIPNCSRYNNDLFSCVFKYLHMVYLKFYIVPGVRYMYNN